MVSEVGTTQEPKCEFGDDCGRYVDEDEVTLNKGSENTVDNSEVENPGGQGVDYSKIAESRSEQISIGNTGEYERRGNPTHQGSIIYRQQIPKTLAWERWTSRSANREKVVATR